MVPKWMYPLAFAFVLFLIYSDATAAGDMAGRFAGFIVDLLGALGQFLTGLFEGAGESGGSTIDTSTTTTLAENTDSFTQHTHPGESIPPHTHPAATG